MQVIFIHHSCFLVEVDNKVLIFDYFDRNRVNGYTFHGKIPTYEPDTPIYMFASHSHTDHFDMDILRWADEDTDRTMEDLAGGREAEYREYLDYLQTVQNNKVDFRSI